MKNHFYPRKTVPVVKHVPDVSDEDLIERIIEARENGDSRDAAVGGVLQGASNVQDFVRVWKEVEVERARMAAIDPSACADEEDYRAKLLDSPRVCGDVDAWVAAKADALDGAMPYGTAVEAGTEE